MSAPRTRATALAIAVAVVLGLTACGGDEDSSESAAGESEAQSETADGVPSLETVLSCLQEAGLEAEDQSSSTGETVGIDYAGGRTVISFEETEEDAETLEGVAQGQDPAGEAFREGSIVVSIPGDPEAIGERAAIETCVAG